MKAELVFVPFPIGNLLTYAVEGAKFLVERDDRLSVTVLILRLPNDDSTPSLYIQSLTNSHRIRFILLPPFHQPDALINHTNFMRAMVEYQKSNVKESVTNLILDNAIPDAPRLAGFVIDMFCTPMIDVAKELGVPTYTSFTASAAYLSLEFHVQFLHDNGIQDVTELNYLDWESQLTLPGLKIPVPAKVFPTSMLNRERINLIYDQVRRFRETKGIIINTFHELESDAINSLSDGKNPPVYPIGPLLTFKDDDNDKLDNETSYVSAMQWLHHQPPSSVVYLGFGSLEIFHNDQVKEIARALEASGHRFLWSLFKPPTEGDGVLPEGFLDRMSGIGKIIGWPPQSAILAHPATGGFVSHCGWEYTLESLWHGVPIAAWPLYADQQFHAFELVVELGLAVEIKVDYRNDFIFPSSEIVRAGVIEEAIRRLMDPTSEITRRVKEMSQYSQKALMEGGSSQIVSGRFIQDLFDSMPKY